MTSRHTRSWFRCRPGDVPVTYADTSALERDFGYKPSTEFENWICETSLSGTLSFINKEKNRGLEFMENILELDKQRYSGGGVPRFFKVLS